LRRFLYDGDLGPDREVAISGGDARHIASVLRMQPGDRIVLFNASGDAWEAVIARCHKKGVVATTVQPAELPSTQKSAVSVTIAQSMLKDRKMDVLVRQLTELGIHRWIPVFTERSVARPDNRRMESRRARWQKITQEALKQCGRIKPMEIQAAMAFEAFLAAGRGNSLRVMFWEEESTGGLADLVLPATEGVSRVTVLIGPEGGFTAVEAGLAQEAGFVTTSLGPRILKAETASVAAATLVQHLFGDMM